MRQRAIRSGPLTVLTRVSMCMRAALPEAELDLLCGLEWRLGWVWSAHRLGLKRGQLMIP